MKRVGVELGTSSQGYFEGVGVITVSIPGYKNDIFVLYPAFYSSTDKYSTISTGALKSNTGFKSVVLDAHQHLELTLKEGNSFKLPCTVIDDIDFIHFNVHIIHKQAPKPSRPSKKNSFQLMSLQPISITNKSIVGTSLFTGWLHIEFGH